MTDLTFTHILAPTPTGFTKTQTIGGIVLSWDDKSFDGAKSYLLYSSTTNNRNAAVLVDEISDTRYFYATDDTEIVYFWLRCRSIWDQVNGDWSADVSNGLASKTELVKTVNIYPNAVTDFIIVKSANVDTFISPLNWTMMLDVTFEGRGNQALIQSGYNNIYDTITYIEDTNQTISTYLRRMLTNITAGGSDTNTGFVYGHSHTAVKPGTNTWSNLSNLDDPEADTYASMTWISGNGNTSPLCLYGFDFSAIPDDAIIYDFQIGVTAKIASAASDAVLYIRPCWDGSDYSSTGPVERSFQTWTSTLNTTKSSYTHGRGTEQYLSWTGRYNLLTSEGLRRITAADIKDPKFGVSITCDNAISPSTTLHLYNVGVKVYYTTKKISLYDISTNLQYSNDYIKLFNPQKQHIVSLDDGVNYRFSMDIISSLRSFDTDRTISYSNEAQIVVQEIKR